MVLHHAAADWRRNTRPQIGAETRGRRFAQKHADSYVSIREPHQVSWVCANNHPIVLDGSPDERAIPETAPRPNAPAPGKGTTGLGGVEAWGLRIVAPYGGIIKESITPMTHEELSGYPVVIQIPVQWGDMDAYGHVNNTVYFRFFESARIAYLERCGFVQSYERARIGAILHSTSCRFRRPLTHPDEIQVGGRVTDMGADRFTMAYRIVSGAQGAVAADGTGLIVSFDYRKETKVPLPEDVRAGIERLERNATR